jgi:hypothetical protein
MHIAPPVASHVVLLLLPLLVYALQWLLLLLLQVVVRRTVVRGLGCLPWVSSLQQLLPQVLNGSLHCRVPVCCHKQALLNPL